MLWYLMPPKVTRRQIEREMSGLFQVLYQDRKDGKYGKKQDSCLALPLNECKAGAEVEDGGYSTESPKVDFETDSEILALN
jgi:hypothetical protein